MTFGAKILALAAALCLLLWVGFLVIGAQPLVAANTLKIIYGEQEDFFSDAAVYQKVGNGGLYILHLPRARPAYRWWTVDFRDMAITVGGAPRSLGTRMYLLRGERGGTRIDDRQKMGEWYWRFTEGGAAFAGNGFTCSVRKTGK
jgi:hypothetical protein